MTETPPSIRGPRITLVPATVALLEAEARSLPELGLLLGASVPPGWPPGEYDDHARSFFLDRLREDPSAHGWYGWYAVAHPDSTKATVVGAAGFFGPPSPNGTVEIGYSIVGGYRRRGYATEIAGTLVRHAWSVPAVRRIIARTDPSNLGSITVLMRCGFRTSAPDSREGQLAYELRREA